MDWITLVTHHGKCLNGKVCLTVNLFILNETSKTKCRPGCSTELLAEMMGWLEVCSLVVCVLAEPVQPRL